MATVHQIRRAQRADGPAAVLAIGTANPESFMLQDDYADYYAGAGRVRLSEGHRRVGPSGVRHNPPRLRLSSLLGLRPTVSRTILSLNGCSGGGRALQLAKELAEKNSGARVLVACSELTLMAFYGPEEGRLDTILGQGIFGDGASAAIVGADPVVVGTIERPLFEMAFATQTTIPDTVGEITMQLMKGGLDFHVSTRVPKLLKNNIERVLVDAFEFLGVSATWNDLFWAVHPGGRAILDHVEELLPLDGRKLASSRRVLSQFGNMSGATVIFVLDELRRRMARGEEVAEWGVMMAFGPGITIETMVLHATCILDEI
ncbi:unnamed protein product [Alopecurus aequalis]